MCLTRSPELANIFFKPKSSIILRFPQLLKSHRRAYSILRMPEWYPVTEDAFHTVQPCKNFIVRLPSENYKVIDLKPNSYYPVHNRLTSRSINLGKFGSFYSDQLIGKPFGPSWEILPNKEIKLLEREAQEEEGTVYSRLLIVDDVYVRDNRDVFDDRKAQLLSAGEIREARNTMSSKVGLHKRG
jgi:Gcd10p family